MVVGVLICCADDLGLSVVNAPAPPVPLIPLLPTSVRRSAVSPPPPTAVSAALSQPPLALKCPRIPQVDTIASAHFGHHPHLPTLRPDVTDRTLTHDKDPAKAKRVMNAMLQMNKIEIKGLQQAYDQG